MKQALTEQRGCLVCVAVGLGAVLAAAGCDRSIQRVDEPIRIVSARTALGGYRVPEYVKRVERPIPPTPPVPPPDNGTTKPPPPTPRPHPEWAAAHPRSWRYIVVHHSHTLRGNAAIFGRYHLEQRHWENGLGYHFVIGNGTDSGDGVVEVGPRWRRQIQGAHAGVRLYNQVGIGICLVGDFEKHKPTKRQLDALVELVNYLCTTYTIPRKNILRHGDIKNTKCPGKFFPFDALFRKP